MKTVIPSVNGRLVTRMLIRADHIRKRFVLVQHINSDACNRQHYCFRHRVAQSDNSKECANGPAAT